MRETPSPLPKDLVRELWMEHPRLILKILGALDCRLVCAWCGGVRRAVLQREGERESAPHAHARSYSHTHVCTRARAHAAKQETATVMAGTIGPSFAARTCVYASSKTQAARGNTPSLRSTDSAALAMNGATSEVGSPIFAPSAVPLGTGSAGRARCSEVLLLKAGFAYFVTAPSTALTVHSL